MTDFKERLKTRLKIVTALITLLFLSGLVGYMLIEKMSFLDAFYMTVITLSTVGFREVKPLSQQGKLFTSILIISGVGTFTYAITSLSQLVVEGEIRNIFASRRRERFMKKLENHVIVCGFGRVGEKICEELSKENVPFVIIDDDPKRIEVAEQRGYLFVFMDSTETEALEKANIKKARTLIAALGDDADNMFLSITAKELNPNILVVARANNTQNIPKLKKAGADKVIAPHIIGALSMAHAAVRPAVSDFIELATTGRDLQLLIEEIRVPQGSPVSGKSILELDLRKRTGAIILAVVKKSGKLIKNPDPSEKIEEGDLLIALGGRDEIKRLENLITTGSSFN